MNRILISMMSGLLGVAAVQAQPEPASRVRDEGWTALGMVSLPQGSFGRNAGGGATLGFGLGGEYATALTRSGQLLLASGAMMLHHPLDPSYFHESFEEEYGGPVSISAAGWNHLALLTGLRLATSPDPGALLYLQMQAGAALSDMGDIRMRGQDRTISISGSPAFAPAVALGAGVKEGRFGVSVRYLHLGKPEFNMSSRNGNQMVRFEASQTISLFAFLIGWDF
jgi:hypothetical protein